MTPRLVVMISGAGTNLQALIDAIAAGRLRAEIALVVSNRRQAPGLDRARGAGLPTHYAPLKPYLADGRGRTAYDADLAEPVAAYRPDLIVLAGWLHVFSAAFLDRFPGRVINLHPALPGRFPGLGAIERAWAAHVDGQLAASGCMVHYVVPEVDTGPVIAQRTVPFLPGDTLNTFAARLHAAEHEVLVDAVRQALGV